MARTGITVRGAGIFGLSIAWACAQRGARVVVVDPNGAGAGSSGGVVGALAPHVPENWNAKKAFQFDSLIMAQDFWTEVAMFGGVSPGYGRTGRLQPLNDQAAVDLARARAEQAEHLWQGQATWRVISAGEALGWAPVSPSGWLVHDTLTARLHPARAVAALVSALNHRGVQVVPEAPDREIVIWATGAQGLEDLSQAFDRKIGMGIKGQAALLEAAAPDNAPQLFADGIHVVPHADGTVAIGSTTEREYQDAESVDDQLDHLIESARAAVPVLAKAPVRDRWAGYARVPAAARRSLAHGPGVTGISSPMAGSRSGSAWPPRSPGSWPTWC